MAKEQNFTVLDTSRQPQVARIAISGATYARKVTVGFNKCFAASKNQSSSLYPLACILRKTKLFQKMMYSKNHEDIDYRAVQLLTMSDRIQHGFEVYPLACIFASDVKIYRSQITISPFLNAGSMTSKPC